MRNVIWSPTLYWLLGFVVARNDGEPSGRKILDRGAGGPVRSSWLLYILRKP